MSFSITSAEASEPRVPGRRVIAGCMAFFALLLVMERLHTYSEPIERDIAGYAVIAHEMLQGRNLYSDLWERKPPLLYATFAIAQVLCGYGPGEIFFLNISAAIATMVALYFAGTGLSSNKKAGLFAAGFWVLISGDMYTQANQPNAEVFVNAFLTAAFVLLVHWPARRQMGAAVLLGALFAAASLYKQHVAVTCMALSVAHVLGACFRADMRSKSQIGGRVKDVAIAAAVAVTAWTAIAGYFWIDGRWSFFFDTLFRQNINYSGHVGGNLLSAFLPRNLFPGFVLWVFAILPLVLAAGLIDRSWMQSENRPKLLLWIAWAAGSALSVALPGKFLGHYYQLWMPVWCAAAGWAASVLIEEHRLAIKLVCRVVLTGAIACIALSQIKHYLLPADEWARRKYPSDHFVEQRQMGALLAELLPPDQSFYNVGEDNPLYFYSDRSPASGLLYLSPLETGADAAKYEQRLLNDLNRSKPDMIVVSPRGDKMLLQRSALAGWIEQNYVQSNSNLGYPIYRIMVKADSALARRLDDDQKVMATVRDSE